MDIKKISVVGLGQIGTPVATLLLKAGYEVTGFDLAERQITELVPPGLKPARSARDAARGADRFMLSLPN